MTNRSSRLLGYVNAATNATGPMINFITFIGYTILVYGVGVHYGRKL